MSLREKWENVKGEIKVISVDNPIISISFTQGYGDSWKFSESIARALEWLHNAFLFL